MSQSLDSLLQVEKEFLAQNCTQIKIEENDFYGIFEQSTKSLDSVLEEFFFYLPHRLCKQNIT